jgi:hypothetical protein
MDCPKIYILGLAPIFATKIRLKMTNLLSEGQKVIFVIIIAKLLKKSRGDPCQYA